MTAEEIIRELEEEIVEIKVEQEKVKAVYKENAYIELNMQEAVDRE